MSKYFKNVQMQDLIDVQDMSAEEFSDYVHTHLYITCSSCGREYQYHTESPLLKNKIWLNVVKELGLEELDNYTKTHQLPFRGYIHGSAIQKLSWVNELLKIDKAPHCTVCRQCMEKALGRPLTKSDLMNKN